MYTQRDRASVTGETVEYVLEHGRRVLDDDHEDHF